MKPNMSPDEFRRAGYEVVDWIAGFLRDIRSYPVTPAMEAGDLMDRLPASAPEHGEPMEKILEDFRSLVVPAATHWNHPRFFAYFATSAPGPAILAEMLSAALNMNGMLWKSGPALTELEQAVLGWLRQWLGLPDEFFGLIYDTASVSSFHAIVAARDLADPDGRQLGGSRDLVVYTSEQSHSSIEKGAIAAGIGHANVRKIAVDAQFRMRTDALRAEIERDRAGGKRPCCVVATAGSTSTTSADPIAAIADLAAEYGLWLHVDASYGGAAAVLPEHRYILDGAARADSLVMNPHKWLFTPLDLSAFYTRRPEVLRRAFSLVPEYLKTTDTARTVNLMDYGIQLGRRFRSLKLWFVMRYLGREGVCELLRNHIRWASELAVRIGAHACFELAAPAPLSVVCFRYKGSDEQNQRLLELVNETRSTFLSHTVLNGRYVLRLAIGNIETTQEDVQTAWELVESAARQL